MHNKNIGIFFLVLNSLKTSTAILAPLIFELYASSIIILPFGFCLSSNLCGTGLIYLAPTFISSAVKPNLSAIATAPTIFKIFKLPSNFVLILIASLKLILLNKKNYLLPHFRDYLYINLIFQFVLLL